MMANKYLINNIYDFAKKKHIQINEVKKKGVERVNFMTVHKSKGLQAKIVILLDVTQGLYGFPSELENPTILNIVTRNEFENEKEERRLFYVALTRAKEELYIYTHKKKESKFLKEIEKYCNVKYLGIQEHNIQSEQNLNNFIQKK